MTDAGATHPYGNDPEDRYIRIAPSFPSQEELGKAIEVFCSAVKLATAEKLVS
jgi:DNA-binding transcriptional MocR family regulator